MTRLDSIAYYHLFKVPNPGKTAGGRALTARQQSVPFYHLGHTGISTTRVPDLDTSLAINGFKTLATCHMGQDERQNAHPAASMIAGASLPHSSSSSSSSSPSSLPFSVSRAQYGESHAAAIIAA